MIDLLSGGQLPFILVFIITMVVSIRGIGRFAKEKGTLQSRLDKYESELDSIRTWLSQKQSKTDELKGSISSLTGQRDKLTHRYEQVSDVKAKAEAKKREEERKGEIKLADRRF